MTLDLESEPARCLLEFGAQLLSRGHSHVCIAWIAQVKQSCAGGGGVHDQEPRELSAIDGGQGALNEIVLGCALLVLDVLRHGDDLSGGQIHRVEPAEANAGERDSLVNVQGTIWILSKLEIRMEGKCPTGHCSTSELNQVMVVVTVDSFFGCQTCIQYGSTSSQT